MTKYIVIFEKNGNRKEAVFSSLDEAMKFSDEKELSGYYVELEEVLQKNVDSE